MSVESYCGTACSLCSFREKTSCPGCRPLGGKMFWGTCGLAACCIERKLEHCGQCAEFPCEQLKEYSFDSKHGDNGRRIENIRRELGKSA